MTQLTPRVKPRRNDRGPNTFAVLARTAVIVVAVLAGGELLTRAIADHLPPPESAGAGEVVVKREALEGRPSVPLVVVGDSTMDAGFDPGAFVAASTVFDSTYNASLLGARIPVQRSWLHEVVLPNEPGVIVHSVNPALLMTYDSDPANLMTLDAVIDRQIVLAGEGIWARADRRLTDSSALFRYRPILRNPAQVWAAARSTALGEEAVPDSLEVAAEAQLQEGFWESVVSPEGRYLGFGGGQVPPTVDPGPLAQVIASPRRAAPLEDLLGFYRSTGRTPILVVPPVPLEVMEASGVDTENWRAAVADIREVAEAAGVVVLDYTDAGYPIEYFADLMHLNDRGSERFSRDLALQLDELCAGGLRGCP